VDDLLSVASPESEPAGALRIGMPPFLADVALETVDLLRRSLTEVLAESGMAMYGGSPAI
jgi:hypothetical protein